MVRLLTSPIFLLHPGSQFFNFEQPCNWSRYYLYQNKTPRYQGASSAYDLVQSVKDLTESPNGAKYVNGTGQQANDGLRMSADASQELLTRNENLTDITLYQRCEKCPHGPGFRIVIERHAQKQNLFVSVRPFQPIRMCEQ
jgi:hypothetical protein